MPLRRWRRHSFSISRCLRKQQYIIISSHPLYKSITHIATTLSPSSKPTPTTFIYDLDVAKLTHIIHFTTIYSIFGTTPLPYNTQRTPHHTISTLTHVSCILPILARIRKTCFTLRIRYTVILITMSPEMCEVCPIVQTRISQPVRPLRRATKATMRMKSNPGIYLTMPSHPNLHNIRNIPPGHYSTRPSRHPSARWFPNCFTPYHRCIIRPRLAL